MLLAQQKTKVLNNDQLTLGDNIKQQKRCIDQLINNFDFEHIEKLSSQIISTFGDRGLGKKILNKLNYLLLDNVFIAKQKYLQYQSPQKYDILCQYQSILELQKPFLKTLFKKHEQLKILYAIKIAYKQWDQQLQNNIKTTYIQFRQQSLTSVTLVIERIFDIYEKYHKAFSFIHGSQITSASKNDSTLIYNLAVEQNDFISWQQYNKIVSQMDVKGYFYINKDSSFNMQHLLSYDKYLEMYKKEVGTNLTEEFLNMSDVIFNYRTSDSGIYKNVFVVDSDESKIRYCYRICIFQYLVEQQSEIINYELSLAGSIFSKNVVDSHYLEKMVAHIKCYIIEIFEELLLTIIQDFSLYEIIIALEFIYQKNIADNIHRDVLIALEKQLRIMLKVQVFNISMSQIRHPGNVIQRLWQVSKALNRLDMNCFNSAFAKKQQILAIFQFQLKSEQICQLINKLRYDSAEVPETKDDSQIMKDSQITKDEDPNEGFQLLVQSKSLQLSTPVMIVEKLATFNGIQTIVQNH